jgi:HEAT repeat protein
MGFWSRLTGILTNRKQQNTTQPPSTTANPPSTKSSSPTKVADSTPPLESLPPKEVVQQVDQVERELETIVPEQPLAKQHPESTSSFPPGSTSENLNAKVSAWGDSRQVKYIPQLLKYANAPDARLRTDVALALGKIAKANPRKAEVQRTISVLGNLSGDRVPEVSQNAVVALGAIRSEQVLPFLQKALRHPSSKVSRAASSAIKQLHLLHEVKPEVSTVKPPAKPIHHRFHH